MDPRTYRRTEATYNYADNKSKQTWDHVSSSANSDVARNRNLDAGTRTKGALNAAVDKISEGAHAVGAEWNKQKAMH